MRLIVAAKWEYYQYRRLKEFEETHKRAKLRSYEEGNNEREVASQTCRADVSRRKRNGFRRQEDENRVNRARRGCE